jgi:ABC-2 type transport system permease protein/oleandomycin transport system permease protein
MTATAMSMPITRPVERSRFGWAVADSMAIAGRNLITLRRVPQLLVFATIQPVIFVLMFTYVFGGAIQVPGIPYVDYLMPGIFVQTVTFGAMNTGVGLAEDLHKGLIERFRSLPMARSAVLAGRTTADLVRNVFVVFLMLVVGYLVGFRMDTNVVEFFGAITILLLFAFALSWIFALVGMAARNAESAQAMSFPIIAPLVFASSAFVPVDTMPSWLQGFATHQPVSVTVNAVRGLLIGGAEASQIVQSVLWSVGLIAVFAPLAVRRYRRSG